MALDDSALLEMIEMLRTADGGELMRRLLGGMLQGVVDAEAAAHIGAQLHERTDARTTLRNGTRDKLVTTGVGDLTVKIPKVRKPRITCRRATPGRAGTSTTKLQEPCGLGQASSRPRLSRRGGQGNLLRVEPCTGRASSDSSGRLIPKISTRCATSCSRTSVSIP